MAKCKALTGSAVKGLMLLPSWRLANTNEYIICCVIASLQFCARSLSADMMVRQRSEPTMQLLRLAERNGREAMWSMIPTSAIVAMSPRRKLLLMTTFMGQRAMTVRTPVMSKIHLKCAAAPRTREPK